MSRSSLRWGVLGAAWIADRALLPALRDAGGEVVALASRDLARARAMARRQGVAQALEGYQALLGCELDAVYIALPNALHREWTERALEAGKHVLCEKPLGLSRAQALAMGAASRRLGRGLGEALMYRHHPRWAQVRALVGEGRLGRPRHLQASFTFPLAEPDIRWQPELGGGALLDVGSYLVSASRWLLGEPSRVLARASTREGVDAEGCLLLEFPSGSDVVDAELAFGFRSAEHQELLLIGSEGALRVPKPFTAWHGEALPLELLGEPGSAPELLPGAEADPYREMVVDFSRSVLAGRSPATSWEDAALTLGVLDAARRSLESGAWERP